MFNKIQFSMQLHNIQIWPMNLKIELSLNPFLNNTNMVDFRKLQIERYSQALQNLTLKFLRLHIVYPSQKLLIHLHVMMFLTVLSIR